MADWLALYGAVIGTSAAAGVVWNIYNTSVRDRARLKMRLSRGSFANSPSLASMPGSPRPDEWVAFVGVSNIGRRPITISGGGGVEFPDDSRGMFMGGYEGLPKELTEGRSLALWMPEDSLVDVIREHGGKVPTHIWFGDATGKRHRTRIPKKLRSWLQGLAARGEAAP